MWAAATERGPDAPASQCHHLSWEEEQQAAAAAVAAGKAAAVKLFGTSAPAEAFALQLPDGSRIGLQVETRIREDGGITAAVVAVDVESGAELYDSTTSQLTVQPSADAADFSVVTLPDGSCMGLKVEHAAGGPPRVVMVDALTGLPDDKNVHVTVEPLSPTMPVSFEPLTKTEGPLASVWPRVEKAPVAEQQQQQQRTPL